MAEFKLSASLTGHEDDVRAVIFPSQETVISASRDSTVRIWNRTSTTPPTYDDTIAVQGSAFINSVTYAPSTSDYSKGLIISGGKDTIIDVRQPGQPPDSDAERLLLGHQGNVCALDICRDGPGGYLVSGSWDASAMVWSIAKGESTVTLEGHEGSVWAVLAYDKSTIITACADKHIRIFRTDGKLVRRLKASSDVVRALCKLPSTSTISAQFASAGNDGIIHLWTLSGTEVAQLHGHENFVYALATLPTGELISASEDRTVRIWRDGACVQTITHPAISVWTVAVCPETGDIATGASDRIVRIFSRDTSRHADAATLTAFDDAVRGSSIPQQAMGDINKDKLPGPEFLTNKSGTKEGQVQLIREANGNVSAHQWSTAANAWISVGTVVDAAGSSGRKQEYLGQDYDYVFDVDIAEGKPPLKLPYNLSQNPYEAAHKFIADNELPMDYLDQVANFIVQNTQGATIGQQAGPGSSQQQAGGDPWGQESRYRPGDASATSSAPTPTPSRNSVLPQVEYLTITTASYPVIVKKINELNTTLISSGKKDISLSPGDLAALSAATKALETTFDTTANSAAAVKDTTTLDPGLRIAIKIATQWPPANRIPGLDLYRLFAAATPSIIPPPAHSSTSDESATSNSITEPFTVLTTSGALPQSDQTAAPANANATMLALRALTNLFNHPQGRTYVLSNFPATIHPAVHTALSQNIANRNVLIAGMTLYINLAVALTQSTPLQTTTGHAQIPEVLLSDLLSLLADPSVTDSEAVYRALVALGTLVAAPTVAGMLTAENRVQVKGVLGLVGPRVKEPRVGGCVGEIGALLG